MNLVARLMRFWLGGDAPYTFNAALATAAIRECMDELDSPLFAEPA